MREINMLITNLRLKINNIRQDIMKLNLETEVKIKERYNQINDLETIICELEKMSESEEQK